MEFEQFGWNQHTVSFIGAMVTSVIGFVGVIIQYRKIADARRAKSVNVTMMSYGALFFAAGGVFGAYIRSFALMFGAIRVFLQLPVLGRIWKHKGFTRIETVQRYPEPAAFPGPKFRVGWVRFHIASMYDFQSNVVSGKPSPPTLYDGFRVQEVMEAALESSDKGNWVKLDG